MKEAKTELSFFRRGSSNSYSVQQASEGVGGGSWRWRRKKKKRKGEEEEDADEVRLKRASWSSFPLKLSSSSPGLNEGRVSVRRKSQSTEDLQLQQILKLRERYRDESSEEHLQFKEEFCRCHCENPENGENLTLQRLTERYIGDESSKERLLKPNELCRCRENHENQTLQEIQQLTERYSDESSEEQLQVNTEQCRCCKSHENLQNSERFLTSEKQPALHGRCRSLECKEALRGKQDSEKHDKKQKNQQVHTPKIGCGFFSVLSTSTHHHHSSSSSVSSSSTFRSGQSSTNVLDGREDEREKEGKWKGLQWHKNNASFQNSRQNFNTSFQNSWQNREAGDFNTGFQNSHQNFNPSFQNYSQNCKSSDFSTSFQSSRQNCEAGDFNTSFQSSRQNCESDFNLHTASGTPSEHSASTLNQSRQGSVRERKKGVSYCSQHNPVRCMLSRTTSEHIPASVMDASLTEDEMEGAISAPVLLDDGSVTPEDVTSPKIIYAHRKTPDTKRRSRKEIVRELETVRRTGSLPVNFSPPKEDEGRKENEGRKEEEKENHIPKRKEEKPKRNIRLMQGYRFFGRPKGVVKKEKEERAIEGRREERREEKQVERRENVEGRRENVEGRRENVEERRENLERRIENVEGMRENVEDRMKGKWEGGESWAVEEEGIMEEKRIGSRRKRIGEKVDEELRWEVEEGEMEVKEIDRREGIKIGERMGEGVEIRLADICHPQTDKLKSPSHITSSQFSKHCLSNTHTPSPSQHTPRTSSHTHPSSSHTQSSHTLSSHTYPSSSHTHSSHIPTQHTLNTISHTDHSSSHTQSSHTQSSHRPTLSHTHPSSSHNISSHTQSSISHTDHCSSHTQSSHKPTPSHTHPSSSHTQSSHTQSSISHIDHSSSHTHSSHSPTFSSHTHSSHTQSSISHTHPSSHPQFTLNSFILNHIKGSTVKDGEVTVHRNSEVKANSEEKSHIISLPRNCEYSTKNSLKYRNLEKISEESTKCSDELGKISENSTNYGTSLAKISERSKYGEKSVKINENSTKYGENSAKISENSINHKNDSTEHSENSAENPVKNSGVNFKANRGWAVTGEFLAANSNTGNESASNSERTHEPNTENINENVNKLNNECKTSVNNIENEDNNLSLNNECKNDNKNLNTENIIEISLNSKKSQRELVLNSDRKIKTSENIESSEEQTHVYCLNNEEQNFVIRSEPHNYINEHGTNLNAEQILNCAFNNREEHINNINRHWVNPTVNNINNSQHNPIDNPLIFSNSGLYNQAFEIIEEEEDDEEEMTTRIDSTCFERDMENCLEDLGREEDEDEKKERRKSRMEERKRSRDAERRGSFEIEGRRSLNVEEDSGEKEDRRRSRDAERRGSFEIEGRKSLNVEEESGEMERKSTIEERRNSKDVSADGLSQRKKTELKLTLVSPQHRAIQQVQRKLVLRHISEECGESRGGAESGDEEEVELRSTPSTPRSPAIDLDELFRQQQLQLELEDGSDDMSKVRDLATRLHLSTRRPSYLDWKAQIRERGKKVGEALAIHAPVVVETEEHKETKDNEKTEEEIHRTKEEREEEEQRKRNLQTAVEWVKKELMAMRTQDQQLARQLMRLRMEVQRIRLVQSCCDHQALVDEVVTEAEEAKLAPDLCDMPADLRETFSPVLRDIGVTRMNITSRRFSLR